MHNFRFTLVVYAFAFYCLMSTGSPVRAQDDMMAQRKEMMKKLEPQFVMMKLSSLIHSELMREELEIIPDQVRELEKSIMSFHQEFQRAQREMMEKSPVIQELARSGQHEQAMELQRELQKAQLEICEKHYQVVSETLLPHQLRRVNQIAKQQLYMNLSGFGDEFGLPLAIAEELELTSKEQRELREAIEEARKEYYEEVAKLKEETHERILRSIPADKRDQVKEILGDIFPVEEEQRRMRQGPRQTRRDEDDAD